MLVNLDVTWAVHWPQFQHFAITHVHWWEHVLTVVLPVTGSLVNIQVGQNGRVNVLVTVSYFAVNDIPLDGPTNCGTIRHPVWQARTHFGVNEEQIQVTTNDTVVVFLSFLTPLSIGFQIASL